MKRILCSLTVILIIILLGLFKIGIALYNYSDKSEGKFTATIESECKETQYTKPYIVTIHDKKFIIYIKGKNKKFEIGDIIQFDGDYVQAEGKRNEGGFDYNLYLKTKKIYGTFQAENAKQIGRSKRIVYKWKKFIAKTRELIIKIYKDNLKGENGSLLEGIIIGNTDNISNKTIENFRTSSLTHVLAISGSNFLYIILVLNFINKKIKIKRVGQIISIIAIIFFMELTGNTASVIRAGVMSILLLLSKILQRKYDFWTSLAISTLIQIIYNPYSIFDLGLLLSYGGVLGLVLFNDIIKKKIKSELISGTISANITIIPIMMYNFNTLSLNFVASNIFASIIIEPITILGIISLIFRFKIVFSVLNILLSIFNKIVEICAQIPLSKIYVTTPSIISILFYYVLLFIIVIKSKKIIEKRNKIIVTVTIITLICNCNFPSIINTLNEELLINFVDVGQGDCTFIRCGNKTLLIDGGGSTDSKYDIGKRILIPYLLNKKTKTIDYILVSHFDTDHVGGLLTVMEELTVKNAIISPQGEISENYNKFKQIANKKNINILTVSKGQKIRIKKELYLDILWPNKNNLIAENTLNNNSIVCKLNYKIFSILFTGDIETIAEKQIIQEYNNSLNKLSSTILKVAHHGSKTSSTYQFIEVVNPKITLIGVGKDNKFGHPSKEITKLFEKNRMKIYRTDLNGEISICINRHGKIKKIKTIY